MSANNRISKRAKWEKKRAHTHTWFTWQIGNKMIKQIAFYVYIQSTFYEGYQKIRKKPLWKTIQYVPNFAVFFFSTFTFHVQWSFAFISNKTSWTFCWELHVSAINFIYYLLVTVAGSLIKICTSFEIYY